MRTLGVIALAIAIAGAAANSVSYHVDPNCRFDPQEACDKCPWDISWVQFVADGCDCNKYYQCQKVGGVISYTEFRCDPCMCFSDKLWACSIKISDVNCPTNPPPTIIPIPTIEVYTNCFCVNFDGDAREHEYYKTESSCIIQNTPTFGPIDGYKSQIKLLQSHGAPCHVEIPYFQNNQFRTFSLCGMFYSFTSGTVQGLINNGWNDDCAPGSIQMYIGTNGFVVGGVRTEANQWFTVPSAYAVSPNKWYKTCLIYNGRGDQRTLTITIDDGSGKKSKTNTKRGLVGLTFLEHCNLRLGESLDITTGNIYGFQGLLDSWCFSENLLRTTQCEEGSYVKQGQIQTE